MDKLTKAPLGKQSAYKSQYDPLLLFAVDRKTKRDEINVPEDLPFSGVDIWNAFEVSWLNAKGKPLVAVANFLFPCTSENIIESKSFKLYLNSFNQTKFDSPGDVQQHLKEDLSKACGKSIEVQLTLLDEKEKLVIQSSFGTNIDTLDVSIDCYQPNPKFLQTSTTQIQEALYSNLLKSNCLITGQPDWGSVYIHYAGNQIDHAGLLKYIVSFREHNEFHEQCVERIYMDIIRMCQPNKLTVYARYTRRGGLDINPFRSNFEDVPVNVRLIRQ